MLLGKLAGESAGCIGKMSWVDVAQGSSNFAYEKYSGGLLIFPASTM